ncbi:MAG: A/G-specific adenine glycosylase [Parcubacteria group bacterium GW2011_GWA2_43_11]|nr:MAG: A/G-specific adenine glycosylase [Parcubacteria group bacterium GW2011_GWA2_43_11]
MGMHMCMRDDAHTHTHTHTHMMLSMTDKKKIKELQKVVWTHYKKNGRHTLPWRKTKNPYRILVSEIMLQQTQVARVIPKYRVFLKQFPTIQLLATASLRDVLVAWQGLGYNRRAQALHKLAGVVVEEYMGKMPTGYEVLLGLPGVGPYTASAVCAFAYNVPRPMLETNIRTVFFHHFYADKKQVSDPELLLLADEILDTKNPREWYWALMDYGAFLKESGVRVNSTSKQYTKQSKFKGSDREVRGALLRVLTEGSTTEKNLQKQTTFSLEKIQEQLTKLQREGLVQKKRNRWYV